MFNVYRNTYAQVASASQLSPASKQNYLSNNSDTILETLQPTLRAISGIRV